MSKKKILTFCVVTVVVGTLIFILIDRTVSKKVNNDKSNSNSTVVSNTIDINTEIIDYKKYQELRSDIYKDEVFAIVIMKSDDEVSKTFKEEILKSFNNRKSKVYELDIDKLDQKDLSNVILGVSEIQKYEELTMVTPTLLVSKKGSIVYVREGLMYSSALIENLDKNEIE